MRGVVIPTSATNPPPRIAVLPARGSVMISTDLHGNALDFEALRNHWHALIEQDPDAHWVLLGDTVHGPNPQSRIEQPDLYDFDDASYWIIEQLIAAQWQWPGRIHYVLGNHDHAHVGGPRTRKFYDDEAAQLESHLDGSQRQILHDFFHRALLCVLTPCGALLSHGSPDAQVQSLRALQQLSWTPTDSYERAVLRSFLTSYGQPTGVTEQLLATVGEEFQLPLTLVIHGHDRDEDGYFTEGDRQVCPVLLGARNGMKRFVQLDLSSHYPNAAALRQGYEVRHVHGKP